MPLSFRRPIGFEQQEDNALVHVQPQRQFRRLLAFAGRTIDDIVNSPLDKRDIFNWYRMSLKMERRLEVLELEQQWNGHR